MTNLRLLAIDVDTNVREFITLNLDASPEVPGGGGSISTADAETDSVCFSGQPLYLKANGHVALAQADNALEAQVCGLCVTAAAIGFSATYQFGAVLELSNWTAIVGTSSLVVGQIYFLGLTPGTLTTTPPIAGFVVSIGQALTTQKLRIDLESLPFQL
ncbi:MAG: hypothetical protein KME27_10530 [Lyngbya sp. HA4199-MV5]|jgi:hypothetical protein|nr:hypothetical protein [Lyngbya sp. HA4199-MV5]